MSVRGAYPEGLEKVETAIEALDVLRNLCGELKHLDVVSGNGMCWLLYHVLCGLEDGVEEQREKNEETRVELAARAEQIKRLSVRLTVPREIRIRKEELKNIRKGNLSPSERRILDEVLKERADEDAFAADVEALLNKEKVA